MDNEKSLKSGRKIQRKGLLSLKIFLPILAISLISIGSYAATVSVSQVTLQEQSGVYYDVTGGFTAVSNGFVVNQASAAATSLPYTWLNLGTCNNALTAGHWVYSVTLTISATAIASTTYTYTVNWNTGSGYTTVGTLTFTTPATITPGETVTFLLDTGGTNFTAPTGIVISVV
jgi:hypothetical protein